MRSLVPVVVSILLVAASAAGQVPPGAWMSWIVGTGQSSCQICVYDPSGATVTGFPGNFLSTTVTAKHPFGAVAVSDSAAGTVSFYTLAGLVWSFSTPLAKAMAVQASGDVVTLSGAPFAPATMTRYSIAGTVLWSVALSAFFPVGIRSDSLGNTWVVDTIGAAGLEYVDASGTRFGPFGIPGVTTVGDFEVDAQGNVWVLQPGTVSTPTGTLMRFDTTGALTQSISIGSVPIAFALDACGRPHVLLDAALPQTIAVIDPASGGTVATTTLSTMNRHDSITFDTMRNYWLSSFSAGFAVFDATGASLASFLGTGIPNPAGKGDVTGFRLCAVIDPFGDADGDSVSNRRELDLGFDPLDPASLPPSLALNGLVAGGATFSISVTFPGEAGSPFLTGVSGGNSGIPLQAPDCRVIPLDDDSLLGWWLGPGGGSLATGASGVLDATGTGTLTATLPAGIYGNLAVYLAFGTIDPLTLGLATLSQELMIVVP